MEVNRVYLSLGSNLGDRIAYLKRSIELLKNHGRVVKISSVYETAPWGFESENCFFNICLEYETNLGPNELLKKTQEIEAELGRKREGKGYQSRTLDIDILFFNDLVMKTEELTIPHPHYSERGFVLIPLLEIAENLCDPSDGNPISSFSVHLSESDSIIRLQKLENH